MPRTRSPYLPEFRAEAVRLVRESGKRMVEMARDLYESDKGERQGLTTVEREELQRVRRKNRILWEER
ncbi:hypothetical protein [Desulforudis sp. DRI-14]|uniref:hypothetical protein n=1 Tax=Desulforudis sp. DRI-14 TaxID=3459793 RepID=UPI003BCFD909